MLTKFFKKTFLFTMYVVCPQSFVNNRGYKKKNPMHQQIQFLAKIIGNFCEEI